MKEKILNLINQINNEIISSNALSEIIIKDDKISFAIDIGLLKIDSKEGQELMQKIKDELKKITDAKVNIILTRDDKAPQIKPQKEEKEHSVIKGVKKVIVIASGKGGVGKSTVAVNLAISLKRIGYKVGLVDADIYGPSISYLMNLQGKPDSENNLMIPINNYGVDAISVGSIVDTTKASVWRGPMVSKVLNQLILGTKWNAKGEDIDYLIIDLPPGTGDVHLSLIQQFKPNGALLVSTPHNLSIIDVVKGVDMFKTLQVPILGVIQNMAYLQDENGNKNYLFGKDSVKKMANDLGLNFLGDIPIDAKINQSNDDRDPISHSDPSSQISFRFGEIAEDIVDLTK